MARSYDGGAIATRAERVAGVLFTVRRARWLRGYLEALSEGATGDAALIRGARLGGVGGSNRLGDLVVKKKMEAFLALPDVKQAMRNIYDEVGFSLDDAVKIHVKHVKGEFTETKVGKDGELHEVAIPPSYAALKDYLKVTTPQEPTRMHVVTARANPEREIRTDGSAPAMAPRFVGEQTIEG